MTYSLACSVCDARFYGVDFNDTDELVLEHMNEMHTAQKKRKKKSDPIAEGQIELFEEADDVWSL